MYVCLCHAVTDRTVRSAARAGCCTADEVCKRTYAGASCGMCVDEVERIVGEERERKSPAPLNAK
jgi:bacterioferritin-associated ferredoxin